MALDERQQFKLGFLLQCAEEGLAPDEIRERIKFANLSWNPASWPAAGWEGLSNAAGVAKSLGTMGLVGGIGLGAGAGIGLAKMTDQDIDPEQIKKQELLAAYKQQTDRAKRTLMARSYRQPPAPRSSHF